MPGFSDKKHLPFYLLFLIVFVSRLPFLSAGYGVEEDSWGIAFAAFHTKFTGIYEPSRLPGHPVQELIYSVLWGAGPVIFNGLSAFFSAIATLFFALILQHLKFKDFFLASLTFAFVPVFFISSTYTIDFAWTEAFVLISFYFILKEKYSIAGIFLGLAIGCRITSGAMLLPFIIIFWQQHSLKENLTRMLKLVIPMATIVIIAFLPLIMQYGFSFFMYYDQFPYPPLSKVLYKMTLGVFGFIGILSIVFGLLIIVFRKFKPKSLWIFERHMENKILLACYVIIILYVISYFRLPQKSGYMIPVISSIIILFGYYLDKFSFRIFCGLFLASSFFFSINLTDKFRGAQYSKHAVTFIVSGQEIFFDPFSGPVFSDYSKRLQKIKFTDEVINKVATIHNKTVIIAGWWYNEIMVTLIEKQTNDFVIFEDYINEEQMRKYISDGYEISYLPEQNIYNDLMHKIKVTDAIAKPFN
jgi:hypothetical protein